MKFNGTAMRFVDDAIESTCSRTIDTFFYDTGWTLSNLFRGRHRSLCRSTKLRRSIMKRSAFPSLPFSLSLSSSSSLPLIDRTDIADECFRKEKTMRKNTRWSHGDPRIGGNTENAGRPARRDVGCISGSSAARDAVAGASVPVRS